MIGASLPAGWESEDLGGDQHVLYSPSRLMVTVDFKRRDYWAGCHPGVSTQGQAGVWVRGRGWRQKLVDHAVEWLRSQTKEV